MKTMLFILLMLPATGYASMTDAAALAKAQTLWGQAARTYKVEYTNADGKQVREYRLGCELPNTVLTGKGISWEGAFASVNMDRNGPRRLAVDGVIGGALLNVTGALPVGPPFNMLWDTLTQKVLPTTGPTVLVYVCNP
jgi:hypothetical protein